MLYYQYFLMNLVALFAGAKVQPFFNWPNLFSKIFLGLIFWTRHFCGCKGTTFFSIDQIFFKKILVSFAALARFESGCKSTTFFRNYQIFFQKYFLVYFNELTPFPKAGAKVQLLFKLTKYFNEFFSNYFLSGWKSVYQ